MAGSWRSGQVPQLLIRMPPRGRDPSDPSAPITNGAHWAAKARQQHNPPALRARALCAGCYMCLATSSASAFPTSNPCPETRPPSFLTYSSLLGALR